MNQYLVVGIVFLVVIALLATNKKLVETLKNIYKIEELRKRVIYTIGLLLVYRLGSFVVIPGINPNALGEGSALASQLDGNGLLGLLNVFPAVHSAMRPSLHSESCRTSPPPSSSSSWV